ncbi:MAG: hypothetical protein AVDCRST_MAG12-3108, partial [uncultured Rubrobacteraceae bacterium]
ARQEARSLYVCSVHRAGRGRSVPGLFRAADQRRPPDLPGRRRPRLRPEPHSAVSREAAGAEGGRGRRGVSRPHPRRNHGAARHHRPGDRAGAADSEQPPGHRAAGEYSDGAGPEPALRGPVRHGARPGSGPAADQEQRAVGRAGAQRGDGRYRGGVRDLRGAPEPAAARPGRRLPAAGAGEDHARPAPHDTGDHPRPERRALPRRRADPDPVPQGPDPAVLHHGCDRVGDHVLYRRRLRAPDRGLGGRHGDNPRPGRLPRGRAGDLYSAPGAGRRLHGRADRRRPLPNRPADRGQHPGAEDPGRLDRRSPPVGPLRNPGRHGPLRGGWRDLRRPDSRHRRRHDPLPPRHPRLRALVEAAADAGGASRKRGRLAPGGRGPGKDPPQRGTGEGL